jgi:hypothetical protein
VQPKTKTKKKPGTEIKGKFNDISSAVENKKKSL